MTERESLEVSILISRALEGALSEAEYAQLHRLMEDPAVQAQYFEQLKVDLALRDVSTHEIEMGEDYDVVLNPNFWFQLARAEQNAPALEPAESPDARRVPVAKVEYERTVHRVNKTALAVAISALAALLFLLIYINTHPVGRIQVATVVDTYQAQWVGGGLAAGGRVDLSEEPQILLDGVVKLETDEGVDVVIEGPAEFRFTGGSAMEMSYGSLFARVHPSGIGFSVSTPVSRIIDLGTAFGVRADLGGDTELHVYEGKTSLSLKDGKPVGASSQFVTAGQAKYIDGRGMTIREIALQQEAFIADINSQWNWIYRGQKAICLADMVGGGNGLGTGRRNSGIHPETGAVCSILEENRWIGNRYTPVAYHPFIDGVFVPNGTSDQVVSSRGHIFRQCPETRGNFYTEIMNTPWQVDRTSVRLGNLAYSRENENRCLFLHTNLGITYDLDAIRRVVSLSGHRLKGFQALAGISDAAWRQCNADIWILVDGQVRYSRRGIQRKGSFETICLDLTDQDRFLTLAATDGGALETATPEENEIGIDSDWCLFDEPVLVLE